MELDLKDMKIIELVRKEMTTSQIGEELGFSEGNVKRRLRALYKLFNVKGKVGLIVSTFSLDLSGINIFTEKLLQGKA